MNLADPSPGLGWRGLERRTLAERGKPDLVLALALVHHVAISANVPVKEFVDWLASLGTALVIEFPTREDPMVKQLLAPKRDGLHPDYELGYFERTLAEAFEIERSERLGSGTRVLYFAHPEAGMTASEAARSAEPAIAARCRPSGPTSGSPCCGRSRSPSRSSTCSRTTPSSSPRGSSGFDVISWSVLLVVLPPALLLAVELLVGLAGARARQGAHLVLIAGLVTLIAAQALKKSISGSDPVLIVLSVLIGVAVAALYAREPVRSFLRVLSPAPLIFLALFLFTDPISKVAFPDEAQARTIGGVSQAPIVVVLLDELPSNTLIGRTTGSTRSASPASASWRATPPGFATPTPSTTPPSARSRRSWTATCRPRTSCRPRPTTRTASSRCSARRTA